MKTKRIKRPVCYLVGLLAFGLMLYSCLQDETDLDSQETTGKVIKGKNRELSIDVARSWYEARQTPVVTTRSVVTHFELMTKLHWKKGYENRKGKFEVVEVPLLTRGGAVLMDRETMEKYKDTERGKIRNISRMVIIKNLETGEIINFVMHIVGTYDYLMKAKHFEDMETIRSRGYALEDEERELGARCVAAPVRDYSGRIVGGISVSGPTTRMSRARLEALAPLVIDTAAELSRRLAYEEWPEEGD